MNALLLVACFMLVKPSTSVDISPVADCSIYDTELNNLEYRRGEAHSLCDGGAEMKITFLNSGKEFERSSIELDITKLEKSLDCTDNYEIKDYFQCHINNAAENSRTVSSINSKSEKSRRDYDKEFRNIETERKNCRDRNDKDINKQSEIIKKNKEACSGGSSNVKENK
ncbi:hypothetical protein ACFFRR_009504 [Megaselia abdita]